MEFNLIPIFSQELLKEKSITEIMTCNQATDVYQLILSKEDAIYLIDTRSDVLQATDRLELGGGVISKLILAFKDSPFISQYNYRETIGELIETFYYYKNETQDEISDDDLIDLMKALFDKRCYGSIELLQGRDLESIARDIRYDIAPARSGMLDDEMDEEWEDEINE